MNHQVLADRLKARNVVDTTSKQYITTRPLNISSLSRDSHMVKVEDNDRSKPTTDLPVRLDKLPGNIHLLASNPSGQPSLIPVIVAGDEIFQIQGQQQMQNNVYVLSSPTVSDVDCASGNQNFLTSSSTATSLETDIVRQGARSPTGFLGYHSNTLDHNALTSTSPGLTAVKTSSKGTGTQSVASPVYKSKLEKAVAQNLLMQNMAKDTSSVPKSLSVPIGQAPPQSSLNLTVQSTPQPYALFTNLKSNPAKQAQLNTISLVRDSVSDGVTSLSDVRHCFSPSKPSTKVSKVAEYYKNLISGKIPPAGQSSSWKQPYENMQSQYALVSNDNYFTDNQSGVGTFSCANTVTSFDSEMADPAMLNPPVGAPQIVKEKTYSNINLGFFTLEALWKLREEGILCDAVLLVENEQIKLHRLVLIGASPEMFKQVSKASEPELRLILPRDFIVEHVMTFLYYIYHGVLKISTDNVQQIYRLSAIFGIAQLSKYCYDFCKLAKMGHLIIDSPYQENAQQIRKTGVVDDANTGCDSPSKGVDGNHVRSDSSENITTSPNTATVSMSVSSSASNLGETFDGLSSEINWSKSEQCNIPIRKRGRTRKTMPNSLVKNSEDKLKELTAVAQENLLEDIANTGLNLSGKLNATVSMNKFDGSRLEVDSVQYGQNMLAQIVSQEDDRQLNAEIDVIPTEDKEVNDNREVLFEHFPDPLLSGKLDENELKRVKRHDDKNDGTSNNSGSRSATAVHSGTDNLKTAQPQQKTKCGSNIVTGSTPRYRRRKTVKKNQKTQESAKSNSEIRRILSNPNKSMLPFSKFSVEFETLTTGSISLSDVSDADKNPPAYLAQRIGTKKNLDKEKTGQFKSESIDRENTTQDAESSESNPSTPKKTRLRKSTLDQQDFRDTVYMRPPPKKRTKEIREMMRNEEDGILKHKDIEENFKFKAEKKIGMKEFDKGSEKSRKSTSKKRQRMKNDALMAKVYEIEKMAVDIEGEKVYRCSYCSVEFKFAKRAVTHLVGTHSVYLEDTPFLVSVEMKRDESKEEIECEVCGYKPKESGSYYIHYHKYFRHQIPLPKGWQAYKCDLCQKEFFTKFQLREHKLIHFEDNPFVCEQCGSGFRSRTCLNSHVFHKHNSIRKHKCSECPKSFKTATQMKVHQRIHTGEKPFKCPYGQCTYRSTTRGNMKLHLTSKHKMNLTSVKKLMEQLEASDGFEETVEPEDVEEQPEIYNEPDIPVVISNESGTETVPFDILVESSALENDVTSKRLPGIGDHIGNLNKSDTHVAVFTETVTDNNAVVLNNRDYSSVTPGNLQGHDLDMVMQENGQILETQNIPRHVQILIQDAHRYMQHQECPPNSQFVSEFQHSSGNEAQDVRARFSDQVVTPQTYESTSRFMDSVQSHASSDIIDPHSKEARMIIKEAFSANLDRSLLKSAMQATRLETRHMQDNSNIQESELPHNETEKLVKDLHDQQIANAVSQDEEVVRSLRSQIQQLREYGRNDALFRDDQAVQDILLQNITSQQSIDAANFPGYHHATISPPAYSTSGHGILSLSASSVVAQSNVVMATTSPDEGQCQVQQLPSVMQGHGYSTVTSQAGSSQYGPDGNIYQGYYQEQQYDIENY